MTIIDQLPSAPQPTDSPTSFNAKAFALVAALPDFATQANALAVDVNAGAATATTQAGIATTQAGVSTTQAGIATTQAGVSTTQAGIATAQAVAAAASAASAAAMAGAFVGTSTSSISIGLGNKSFATQSGEQYTTGIWMTVVSQANAANFMFGQVVSYSGTTLVIDVQSTGGGGTYADWNLSLAGVRGAPGAGITPLSVGFNASGGITPKTLTVDADLTASQVQALLVSGINIKTIGGTSLLGSGDISAGASYASILKFQ